MNNSNLYDRGCIEISDNFIRFDNTTVSLTNIDHIENFIFDKHSIFAGIKDWIGGFIIVFVICCIWPKMDVLFSIYCFSIFILLAYNIYEHTKTFYGLKICTSAGKCITIRSNSQEFIFDLEKVIQNAINSKNCNYTINLSSHDIINNGIIGKGNKNKNTIKKGEK